MSLNDQIKKLQEGGTPVMSGTMTVGVISQGGSYTGRPEFGDLARSQYRTAGAEIRAPIGARSSRSDGGSERATTPAAAPSQSTPKIALPTTGDRYRRCSAQSNAFRRGRCSSSSQVYQSLMQLDYKPPGPIAKAFMKDEAFVRGIRGPVGSGKSVTCCMEIMRRAVNQKPNDSGIRRSRWAVIRNTNPQLKNNHDQNMA